MSHQITHTITTHFSHVEDPRIERTKDHALLDMIIIALCAVICGADSWVAVETFGTSKLAWFRTFLPLPNGIPSHDTFGRVFARLDPEPGQSHLILHGTLLFDTKSTCGITV